MISPERYFPTEDSGCKPFFLVDLEMSGTIGFRYPDGTTKVVLSIGNLSVAEHLVLNLNDFFEENRLVLARIEDYF